MNIQEYISSGVLEAYVLGELSHAAEQEVLGYAEQFPEVREELNAIELTLEKLAVEAAVTPRGELKKAILDKIDGTEGKVIPIDKNEVKPATGILTFVTAASVILAIVSSVLAYNYYDKYKDTQDELSAMIAQNQRVAEDYNTVNQKLNQIESDFQIISDPDFERIAMVGTDNSPGSVAHIYWNQSTEDVYLSIENLKTLSREKQYQLWAIIDGKPVNVGIFDSQNGANLLKMKNIANAGAFAVTIEPRGGSETPTLETMQVMGKVSKG